jgi:hypothetical protein
MRIIVYTAIFGEIDRLWSVYPLAWGKTPHLLFTDRERREVGLWTDERPAKLRQGTHTMSTPPIWEAQLIEPEWDNRRTARHFKACPHRYIDADVWIWVDGNVRLLAPPEVIVEQYLGGDDLAIFRHPDRACLFAEAQFCAQHGKDKPAVLQAQTDRYKREGMPRNWGLPETRVVIRRNTPQMRELGEAWWAEMERHSVRDQVSIPYVCWKLGIRWKEIPGRCWPGNKSEHFYYAKHRGK